MIRNRIKFLTVLLISATISYSHAWAADSLPDKHKNATVSFGAEFASGDYGTDATTRSLFMPLIATWVPDDRFDLSIEIPLIYQSSSNVTTDLYRNNQGTITAKTPSKGGPGGNRGTAVSAAAVGSSDSGVFGLGDITLRLGVIALVENGNLPQLRPSLSVKFPTANSADGLGTGEFDFGAGLEAIKWFDDLHLTAEGVFTWQGKADGFGLNNYFSYTAGIGYQLTESIEPMLIVKGATAPSAYSGNLLETRARIIWSLTGKTSLDLYGSCGIADSSPDYGAGISMIYSF